MIKHFSDLRSVEEQANRQIERLLSDKSFINPQKFAAKLREYEKRQAKLDAQASASIRNQIDNINIAKKSIDEASRSMTESKEKIDEINKLWSGDLKFHTAFPEIKRIYLYQRNLGQIIEQLGHFINLQSELQQIKQLIKDDNNLEQVFNRIVNLTDLRDNVMGKLDKNSGDLVVIRREFEQVEIISQQFYKLVFEKFQGCLRLAKTNPTLLISVIRIVEKGDARLAVKNQPKSMRKRALSLILESIDDRFNKEFGDFKEITDMLDHSKFIPLDLVEVYERLTKCFPPDYNIFEVYQQRYQKKIQEKIMPHMELLTEEKQYGNLLALMTWIEDYDAVLSKAGVSSNSYVQLQLEVKKLMPLFIDHNQNLLRNYINNCVKKDQQNFHRDFYEQLLQSKSEFISNYPSDIFILVNKEAEIIKEQVRGELFIEFVRCIAGQLKSFQADIIDTVEEEYEKVKNCRVEDKVVDYEYKLLLNLNNFTQCLKHANQAKAEYVETVAEQYKGRVGKIFLNEVQTAFNSSIPRFVQLLVRIVFLDLNRQFTYELFTQKWLEESKGKRVDLVETLMKNVNSELQDIESLVNNPINYRMLVKGCYDYLAEIYAEQLIFSIKMTYGISMAGWQPRRLDLKLVSFTKRPENRKVFNKQTLSENILKDTDLILKQAQQMNLHLNEPYRKNLKTRFGTLRELFTRSKLDFENLFEPLLNGFTDQAQHLLKSVLCVRQQLSRQLPDKLQDFINKKK